MRFKEYLKEFRSNIPLGQSMNKDELRSYIPNAKLQDFVLLLPGKKDVVVFINNFSPNDKFIILADRRDNDDIVGYMWINNALTNGKYWQVMDVTIFMPYQGKGLGFNLYIKLINEGYSLINGFSLSTDVEKLWRKLHTEVNVQTYNKETNEISDFDERPKKDNNPDHEKQNFFWLATTKGNLQESLWHKGGFNEERFHIWLTNSGFMHSFGASVFGDGDEL